MTDFSTAPDERYQCPTCAHQGLHIFYKQSNVPVHSVVLLPDRTRALTYHTGDIALGFCPACGFITNTAFDASLQDYSTDYEATQSYSATFNRFAAELAQGLIDRYALHGKTVLEIGCGQGEFLSALCELGGNQGIGFDPAYRGEPLPDNVRIVADYFNEQYTGVAADLIVCKMTLEHIKDTAAFMNMIRRTISDKQTPVFFQIPNAETVMRDVAFWDVYYEHVSYFSRASLAYLFRVCGFEVREMLTGYDDQYLMIHAVPVDAAADTVPVNAADYARIRELTIRFEQVAARQRADWQTRLQAMHHAGQKVVIWGSGSKGVAFLTALDIDDTLIPYCVDINPRKTSMYMARTGQRIVAPDFLLDDPPDAVIIMNPIYYDEIRLELDGMRLHPLLLTVEAEPEPHDT